ncbi:MAG TPA: YicC/YloC family endoribonuclease [Opitutaceae bacterium]|jgi:uncharacterized protein (TIGR00255 family)
MTGYGRGTAALGSKSVAVQVSSVNRRSLDLSVSLPPAWEGLEPAIVEEIRRVAARGKVHVEVELTGATDRTDGFDERGVQETLQRLKALAAAHQISFQVTPELLWQIATAGKGATELPALEAAQGPVRSALAAALAAFAEMRAKEGKALLRDFEGRAGALSAGIAAIAERAPHVAPAYRELLNRRLRDAGLELNLDDERVLKEIALFADRCDISEELTRFRSHLEQFTALIGSDGEVGRKAEFILQEMNREAHTMGSKANDLAISRAVIELKNELERVKEQMANVE